MIVVLLNGYLAILALFVWLRFIPFNLFWKLSPAIVLVALLLGLFIPMQWGAPSGSGVIIRNSVEIVPDVTGEVVEVAAQPNQPLKAGDVLFKIDPLPYQAALDESSAQVARDQATLAKDRANLERYLTLEKSNAVARQQAEDQQALVQQDEATVKAAEARLESAKWNLDKTTVRAPADGYVTNLALRKGAHVNGQSAVLAFIDTSDTIFGAEIPQGYARYIEGGQPAEVTFKTFPGEVFTGRVESVLQAIATGQVQPSGLAVTPSQIQSAPFVVRIRLDNSSVAQGLPAGSTALVAIFTDHVKAAQVIRKVLLRQTAILNYVNPF